MAAFGGILEALGGVLEALERVSEPFGGVSEALGGDLGATQASPERSWAQVMPKVSKFDHFSGALASLLAHLRDLAAIMRATLGSSGQLLNHKTRKTRIL